MTAFGAIAIACAVGFVAHVNDARASSSVDRPGVDEEGKADTLSNSDRAFLREAAIGGLFEVQLGQAVAQKATRDDVRKFAVHMVSDHSKGNKALADLAKRKGYTELPTKLDEEHAKQMDEILKLGGAELDAKYVSTMVQDHEDDVDAFSHAKDAADDADVRDFAGKALPMLQEHLKSIRAIRQKMQSK